MSSSPNLLPPLGFAGSAGGQPEIRCEPWTRSRRTRYGLVALESEVTGGDCMTERLWPSCAGVVVLAACTSMPGSNSQDLAQEGSVEKSSTAMKAQLGDRVDETLDWNEHLIDALFTAGTSPPPALRVAAIMNVAMFDAANGVYRQFHPIHFDRVAPRGTSRRAAVIGAAYTTLSKLFTTQQSKFDAEEAASLAAMTDDEDADGSGQSTSLGLAWGTTVANDILAWRATDGFTTVYSPFTGGTVVG